MARHKKRGIDYFPLDVSLNNRFQLIEARFGHEGFTLLIKLYQHIYAGEGYYCGWDEESSILFCHKNGFDINTAEQILTEALEKKIFDKNLYLKHKVLTSVGIQKRYFEVVKRRKELSVCNDYLLIDNTATDNAYDFEENVCKIEEDAYNFEENVCIIEQSKVKESKEDKRKVKKSKEDTVGVFSEGFPSKKNIPSLEEVVKFCKERKSTVSPKAFYDYFTAGNWIDSRGSPVINWKQKLITWETKDKPYGAVEPDTGKADAMKNLSVPIFIQKERKG